MTTVVMPTSASSGGDRGGGDVWKGVGLGKGKKGGAARGASAIAPCQKLTKDLELSSK